MSESTAILIAILASLMILVVIKLTSLIRTVKCTDARSAKLDLACSKWILYTECRDKYGVNDDRTVYVKNESLKLYEEYVEMRRRDGV